MLTSSQTPKSTPMTEHVNLPQAKPSDLGFNGERLAAALNLARRSEVNWPRDLHQALIDGVLDAPPYNISMGPIEERGPANGLIMRRGQVAAIWGEPLRADFTFSVAKSYLALLAGIAVGDGLIRDVHDSIAQYATDDDFEAAQNRSITWHHLLQQTSEWEGTLFGLPDLVDRNRDVGSDGNNDKKGTHRDLQAPGEFWEYNDVRVNRLSLSLLQLFKRPLAEVLSERIMQPLGASERWRWHGYYNAEVVVDGKSLRSVPGGSHWGGGLCIDSTDHARVGELVRLRGIVRGKALLPEGWCERMLTPCPIKPDYGYLWWLNTDQTLVPSVPSSSVFALGAGGNHIWIDTELELVVVARWLDSKKTNDVFGAILDSLA
jgi:CubicO group peptidase (beta-lactamase class C family)